MSASQPPPFSPQVQELIQKSRIVSFATWQASYSAAVLSCFQAADDQQRYLSDADCDLLQVEDANLATNLAVVRQLRDQVTDIVDQARAMVLAQFPNITAPGGGLYPEERAKACWRDFWHFLRCMTYGIAGGRSDYTSVEGLHYMNLLYQELHVPLDAMVVGLQGIKIACLERLDPTEHDRQAPYFDHLIQQLQAFK